jgi:hypothetical protein
MPMLRFEILIFGVSSSIARLGRPSVHGVVLDPVDKSPYPGRREGE